MRTPWGQTREQRILDSVKSILDDDFLQNGIRIDRVDSAGLWVRQPNGLVLPLADMSEGYRAALAMLVDLLRHLVEVHGHDGIVAPVDGRIVVPYSGIVLIDEIDAHLHPQWQRTMGFWLKRIFPKIQFIVSTHSAMICQAADTDGIYYLPPPGSNDGAEQIKALDYIHIIQGKPDEILRGPAFRLVNTRSEQAVAARRNYARLRAKRHGPGLSPSEDEQYKQLEMFVGSIEDPD